MAYAIVCLHLNSPQERVWQKAYEMTARVLILSPDTGFGGLIQQTLERAGGYEPLLVSSGRQALDIARKVSFDLAILDADVTDMPIKQLGDGLLRLVPDMRLILIPPEKPLPEFDGQAMRISGYLTKPFYLPDLVDIVERSLSPKPVNILPSPDEELQTRPRLDDEWQMGEALTAPVAPISAGSRLLWLEDVNQAAQTLARLSMASSAQAGLILREGRLWAYAGQLTQAAMQELANLVIQDWRGSLDAGDMDESHVDLARYILLKSTHQEYMLYTTLLEDHLLLALAFNAKMPFSEIRSQAASLVRALTSPPEKGLQFETQGDFSGSEANQTDFVAEEAAWLFDASGEEPQTPGLESATPVDASAEPVSEAEDIQQTRWIYEFAAEVEAGSKRSRGEPDASTRRGRKSVTGKGTPFCAAPEPGNVFTGDCRHPLHLCLAAAFAWTRPGWRPGAKFIHLDESNRFVFWLAIGIPGCASCLCSVDDRCSTGNLSGGGHQERPYPHLEQNIWRVSSISAGESRRRFLGARLPGCVQSEIAFGRGD